MVWYNCGNCCTSLQCNEYSVKINSCLVSMREWMTFLIDPTLCFDSLAANPVFLSSACQIWQFIDHREPFWGKWYQGFQLWFLLLEGWTFLPWLALPTFFTFACNIWLLYFHSGYPNFYHRLTHNFVEFCCCSVRLWWDLLIVVWLYGLQHAKVSLV